MKPRRVRGLDTEAAFGANAALILRARLEELLSLGEASLDPEAEQAQHDTRIAAKRLRYVLELTEGCFGDDAAAARLAARELQGVLGDIHDCDVMLPRVGHIESLSALLRARRGRLFGRFRALWREQAGSGTWAALEARLEGYRMFTRG
jgi:CHAD domain-containing protein